MALEYKETNEKTKKKDHLIHWIEFLPKLSYAEQIIWLGKMWVEFKMNTRYEITSGRHNMSGISCLNGTKKN